MTQSGQYYPLRPRVHGVMISEAPWMSVETHGHETNTTTLTNGRRKNATKALMLTIGAKLNRWTDISC